jgi:hypothetical protein
LAHISNSDITEASRIYTGATIDRLSQPEATKSSFVHDISSSSSLSSSITESASVAAASADIDVTPVWKPLAISLEISAADIVVPMASKFAGLRQRHLSYVRSILQGQSGQTVHDVASSTSSNIGSTGSADMDMGVIDRFHLALRKGTVCPDDISVELTLTSLASSLIEMIAANKPKSFMEVSTLPVAKSLSRNIAETYPVLTNVFVNILDPIKSRASAHDDLFQSDNDNIHDVAASKGIGLHGGECGAHSTPSNLYVAHSYANLRQISKTLDCIQAIPVGSHF